MGKQIKRWKRRKKDLEDFFASYSQVNVKKSVEKIPTKQTKVVF